MFEENQGGKTQQTSFVAFLSLIVTTTQGPQLKILHIPKNLGHVNPSLFEQTSNLP